MMQSEEKVLQAEQTELAVIEGGADTKRRRRLIGILVAVLTVFGLAITSIVGAVYLFILVPYETAGLVEKDPFWSKVNPDAMAFRDGKDFTNAEFYLHAKVRQDPQNPLPNFLLGKLYQLESRSGQAMSHYQLALKKMEDSWYHRIAFRDYRNDLYGRLGILYYEDNKEKEALQVLQNISAISDTGQPALLEALYNRLDDPGRADYRVNLARELRNNLQISRARQELESALKLSKDPRTRNEIMSLMATQMPSQVNDLSPMVRYYSLAGQMHQENEDLKEAARFYEQAVKEMPQFEWDHNELAIIYRQMQDYRKASRYAQEAARLNPNFYHPHLTLGDIALDQSRYQEAIAHFTRAQQIILSHPDSETVATDANIENQLGFAYEQMDKSAEAMAHYRLAMKKSSEGNNDDCECLDAEYEYAESALARLAAESTLKKQHTKTAF